MGEQPIFTTRAHVFHIDPETKKRWLPSSSSAVNVSYFYDSTRNAYRIISVEGSKAIINSTVTPTMTFTKTSQKFGQWSDPRANTIYGLGFSSEKDLTAFVDKFKEIKELTRDGAPPPQQPSDNSVLNLTATGAFPSQPSSNTNASSLPPSSHEPVQLNQTLNQSIVAPPNMNTTNLNNTVLNGDEFNHLEDLAKIKLTNGESKDSGLRAENERLKVALSQSSSNAKKWEAELITLKTNNQRLTAALQESSTNVEEWRKQLSAYKEENLRLKKCLSDSSSADQATSNQGQPGSNLPTTDLLELQSKIEVLRNEGKSKDETIRILRARIDELSQAGGSKVNKELVEIQKLFAVKMTEMMELNQRLAMAADLQ